MKNRLLASFLAFCMVTTVLCTSASAISEPLEIGPYPGQNSSNSENTYLGTLDVDAVINQMIADYRANHVITQEELKRANEIVGLYNEYYKASKPDNVVSLTAIFDDNWWQLRYGNLIEFTLDLEEGLSTSAISNCLAISTSSENTARNNFPSYWDSAQHFNWNFNLTRTYSKQTARTIGNNHEWGIAMIDPMINHFEADYDDYIAAGYSQNDASSQALADTIVYMPVFKYDAVSIMQSSYAFYDSFFTDESLMDFWNNCYGRAYPERGYTSAVTAYNYSAFTANELVLDGPSGNMAANLTSTQKQSIWSWDWYSY